MQQQASTILLIAPQYPPVVNGLGDYAARLGAGLAAAGHRVHYAALPQVPTAEVQPYSVLQPNGTHLWQLVQDYQINTLILNYSGYGYQRKGIPFWLPAALQQVQKKSHCRIIVFFHELYASGPPWTSAFWLHPAQKNIFRSLYQLADSVFCSNRVVANLIQQQTLDGGQKNHCIGLFTNIPEPEQVVKWSLKLPYLVVFGHPNMRLQTYKVLQNHPSFLAAMGITQLIDIGLAIDGAAFTQLPLPVQEMGILPKEKVSAVLQAARFGALVYPDKLLGKSGVMAAYLSHGLCVWNGTPYLHANPDGLVAGQHYVHLQQALPPALPPETIAANGLSWYAPHHFQQHIAQIAAAL
jgi:hypothetical protein